MCSGDVDEKLFKDLRKALIEDEDARNSIKLIIIAGKVEKEVTTAPKVSKERLTDVADIINHIKKFRPPKKPKSEKEFQNMLISYLYAHYPDIQTQLAYERARIDAVIGRVGIEIKYQPNASELDRLYGQVEKYCKYLDKVIVVIGYEKSRQYTESFEQRLKGRDWLNKNVFVITVG